MDLEDFQRFLVGVHRITLPGSGRAAIRGWLSLRHVGQPLSLHQEHALVGGQRIDLAPWVLAFLDVSDRLQPGRVSHGRVIEALAATAWDAEAALQDLAAREAES